MAEEKKAFFTYKGVPLVEKEIISILEICMTSS